MADQARAAAPVAGRDGDPAADPATGAAADPAAELEAIRRRVLNVVGHELRTPATMIRGLAEEVCAADDLAWVTGRLGPALLRNAQRLEGLLDDLLVAAGVSTAVPVDRAVPVDLGPLVQRMWAAVGRGPVEVVGAAAALVPEAVAGRVVEAVLDNAAAYGEGPPAVRLARVGDGVELRVRVPGTPPHPEEVRLATEPFFRGERAVTTRPGLGLGLAVAAALARHHDGDVHLEADADAVTTVVSLPGAAS